MFKPIVALALLNAGLNSPGHWNPSTLAVPNEQGPLIIGRIYRFSGYFLSTSEPRIYSKKSDIRSLHRCISVIYGARLDRKRYNKLNGSQITFTAVVAEYDNGVIIGANSALGGVSLSSFENQCGRKEVLVIVGA